MPPPNPKVVDVEAGSRTVRIFFDMPMENSDELKDKAWYSIVSLGAGVPVEVFSIEPEQTIYPIWVDLITSESTIGQAYKAVITSNKLRSVYASYLLAPFNEIAFTGTGEQPGVAAVTPIDPTTVHVTFTEDMLHNSDLVLPANYVWDNGLLTKQVERLNSKTVKLTTTEQQQEVLYQLDVTG